MKRFDEVARVAVIAEPSRLPGSRWGLITALSRAALGGFSIDLCGEREIVGADHDLIHLLGGRDAASLAAVAREHGIPMVATYPEVPRLVAPADCRIILSPTPAADLELLAAGARTAQLFRWQPGFDPESFGPGHYVSGLLPRGADELHVLHVGRPADAELLAEIHLAATTTEPRLRLTVVEDTSELPGLYASADLLLHLAGSAEFPLQVLEAQASGLPVLALDTSATRELIEDGRSGVLVPADPLAVADLLVSLARRSTLRERLAVGGLQTVRTRTWEHSLAALTGAWTAALHPAAAPMLRAA